MFPPQNSGGLTATRIGRENKGPGAPMPPVRAPFSSRFFSSFAFLCRPHKEQRCYSIRLKCYL